MVTDLITRLSKLDAPDREVDAEIEAVFVGGRIHYNDPANKEAVIERPIDGFWIRGIYPYRKIARYTASVDAAIALMVRLFPGTEYEFTNLYNIVRVTIEMNGEYGGFHGEHVNSLPIALCIALLRAREASE